TRSTSRSRTCSLRWPRRASRLTRPKSCWTSYPSATPCTRRSSARRCATCGSRPGGARESRCPCSLTCWSTRCASMSGRRLRSAGGRSRTTRLRPICMPCTKGLWRCSMALTTTNRGLSRPRRSTSFSHSIHGG
ncbi:hypothetical protein BC828DRAFT_384059, partial [Blastocladiella britannica]